MMKLPTKLYVCWDDQSDDEPLLLAHEEWEKLAESDKTKLVGEYQLIDLREVELKPVWTAPKKRKGNDLRPG